jgi:hypothetical protein
VGHIFLAIVLGVVGVFFLASGFQAYPNDFSWLGWIAIGTGLTAGAISCSLLSSQNVTSTGLNYSPGQSRSRPKTTRRGSGSLLPGRPEEPVKLARQPSCRVRTWHFLVIRFGRRVDPSDQFVLGHS